MKMSQVTKRVRRVQFESGNVLFTLPGGEVQAFTESDFHAASLRKALEYGITRLFQDRLAGDIKDGADADQTAKDIIGKFLSGDWGTTRKGGTTGLTLESVALDMVKSAAKAKGRSLTAKEAKDLATQVLADESRLPKVQAELARRKAEADDMDLGDLI
jgi:hypothetical protein